MTKSLLGCLCIGAVLSLLATDGAHAQDELSIPLEVHELDNGLQVILSEDHSVPVVRVDLCYRVGSKDDGEGRAGFAHLFEHLMFEGSQRTDVNYHDPLQAAGAKLNAYTSLDRTCYHEELPSEQLPLALWMEADRMGWLLIDEGRLRNQQDVVRNERRQNYEDRPYDAAWITLLAALYPDGHPYHHATIGEHEDIEAATLADVQGFYGTHYTPGNATLSIVGDFDPAEARALLDATLGTVPAGPERPTADSPKASLKVKKVIRQEHDVPQARFWIAWLTPPLYGKGDAEMDLLALLLADGSESLLRQRLGGAGWIDWIGASQRSAEYGSVFIIEGGVDEDHTTEEVVAEIEELLREKALVPFLDQEVEVAKTQYERQFIESLGTMHGRADHLQSYAHYVGDPDYIQRDLERYHPISASDIQKALRKYLPVPRSVVLHIKPPKKTDEEEEE